MGAMFWCNLWEFIIKGFGGCVFWLLWLIAVITGVQVCFLLGIVVGAWYGS